MSSKWLLDRLYDHKKQPSVRFAFQGTINWMRGLAILVETEQFTEDALRTYYKNVQRRTVNELADTMVFENILMSLHHISALKTFKNLKQNHYDIVRSAIISWYYGIYYAAKAMIAAESGADPQTHAETAKVWQNNIVQRNLAIGPFGLSIQELTPKHINEVITDLRKGNKYDLNTNPSNIDEAWGCIYSYLQGTAKYVKWEIEERVKNSKDFKKFGVQDFRTRAARELRDQNLERGIVNILTQAFRYRGKANYRDSIYLTYGADRSLEITTFLNDLYIIAEKFLRMAVFHTSKRVESGTWEMFVDDIRTNSQLAIGASLLEVSK